MKIRLSQRHLKILETCPRQFEYTFCDRLTAPMMPDRQGKTQLGSDFHWLMHQRELGLPIEPILDRSPQLKSWMQAMLQTAPELFEADDRAFRDSEHLRTLEIDGYLFTAIYDLVILKPDRADIIDWKTYPLPRYKKDLDREWQTRLYMYLLAETSDYKPQQINFTYWFVQSSPQPKSVNIGYTLKQHRQTQAELKELLGKLSDWLSADRDRQEPFPQVSESSQLCERCHFSTRCQRQFAATPTERPLTTAEITVVSI
jgi:hypothetical protein